MVFVFNFLTPSNCLWSIYFLKNYNRFSILLYFLFLITFVLYSVLYTNILELLVRNILIFVALNNHKHSLTVIFVIQNWICFILYNSISLSRFSIQGQFLFYFSNSCTSLISLSRIKYFDVTDCHNDPEEKTFTLL